MPVNIYFLFTILIFSFYFFIIFIFGFMIFCISSKKQINKKLNLFYILIYFAVGLVIHTIYLLFISFFKIFNFFTVYLPFIIIDICFLYYLYRKKQFSIVEYLKKFKFSNLYKSLLKYFYDIIILIIILAMLYLLQMYFIEQSISLPACDPYLWFRTIFFLHKYGYLDYSLVGTYPPGYIFFCASIISVTNDYYLIYFFCKYIPLILSGINILCLFVLSKRFFIKKINIVFTLAIYLSFNYLSYRYQMLLPSTLATTLGFLFLLHFFNDNSIFNLEYKGLILAGIFLNHHLYCLYYIIFFIIFTLYIFFQKLISLKKQKLNLISKKFIKKFFYSQIYIYLIFIVAILPFLILTSLENNFPIFNYYYKFIAPKLYLFGPFYEILRIGDFIILIANLLINNIIYNRINSIILNLFNYNFALNLRIFYDETIGIGTIIIIIGCILPFNKLFKFNINQKNFIVFIKFTLILSILSYFLLYIFTNIIEISFLNNAINFFSYFFKRYFELFAGYWALIFVLSINFIFKFNKNKLKILIQKMNFKITTLRKFYNTSFNTVIIMLIILFYSTNFTRVQYYQFNSYGHTDVLLFAGNYFNENPPNKTTTILIEDFHNTEYNLWYDNYYLLLDENLKIIYYTFSDKSNYQEFKIFIDERNIKFVLFNFENFSNNFIKNFTFEFKILYINNDNWIFAKLII